MEKIARLMYGAREVVYTPADVVDGRVVGLLGG